MTDSELSELAAKDEVIAEAGEMLAMRDRQLAALKAENEELRKDAEWRDIETAPKETEIFIGRFIDGKFRFGRSELIYEHANEFAGETWSGWLWSIDDCNDSIADCPTHWMPLPKPPAMAQGEQG